MITCVAREQAVWDDILNETYRRLRGKLDAEQQGKLRDMQRAWIDVARQDVRLLLGLLPGHDGKPDERRHALTARPAQRALFLLGFAQRSRNAK